jgi:hypothetical protein
VTDQPQPSNRNRNRNRNRQSQQQQQQRAHRPVDMWRPVPPLPPAEKVAPAPDPTALIRSLGDPPLRFHEADHYLAAVVERAAGLAAALAASGGLLAPSDN